MSGDAERKTVGQDWLAPVEAGKALGVTSARVRQLISAGQLEAVRTPLGRLVDPASVDALRREREARKAGDGG